MVSALNGLGVKEMCRTLKEDMGFRADLWVVGAQNGEICCNIELRSSCHDQVLEAVKTWLIAFSSTVNLANLFAMLCSARSWQELPDQRHEEARWHRRTK